MCHFDAKADNLATFYWSYDACKRRLIKGCMPLICIDGCHIKTRYKGGFAHYSWHDCMFPMNSQVRREW
jgi:hypothetical protein